MGQGSRPWPPIAGALLAQLMALLLVATGIIHDLALQGVLAALFGIALRLPWWWLPINLLFPVALTQALSLALPPWLFLLAFTLLLLFNWNSARERVPFYLSNRETWEGIAQLLSQQETLRFIDLGSGLGGTLFYLARRYPKGRFYGVESAPLPYAISWLRLRLSGMKNIELRRANLWDEELARYTVAYAFLSPQPMPRLAQKVVQEMRNGSLFISNSFAAPHPATSEVIELGDRRHTRLYCYRL